MSFLSFNESYFVEFKESLPHKNGIFKSIVAFSNCLGGKIFIGVNDRREIVGVLNPNFIKRIVKEGIKAHVFPQVSVWIEVKKISFKKVVIINVFEAAEKPVLFDGKIYIRELDKNLPVSFFEENGFKSTLEDDEKKVLNFIFRTDYFSPTAVKKRLNFSYRRIKKIFTSLVKKGWIKNSVYYNKEDIYCLTPEGAKWKSGILSTDLLK